MRPRFGAFLIATGMAIAAPPALAEIVTLGDVSFEIPEGWSRRDAGGAVAFSREFPATADTGRSSALIQVLRVDATAAQLDANFRETIAVLPEFVGDDPIMASEGQTGAGHQIRVERRCCETSRDLSMGQTVVAIATDDTQILAQLVMINTDSDYEDLADADFAALVRSIRFPGDDDALLFAAGDGGGLEGVFTHLETYLMPNVFGGLDFTVENEVVAFDPSGFFSDTLPGDALAAYCAGAPRGCGTYRLLGAESAQQIEMRRVTDAFGTIETETLSFAPNGEDLMIDGDVYDRVPPFPEGTLLEGTWTYSWVSTGITATTTGTIAIQRTLVLDAAGNFRRDGWSGGTVGTGTGVVTATAGNAGAAGTYTLSGYTLTLVGGDGAMERLSVFAPERDSTELLVINGANYLRDDPAATPATATPEKTPRP